MRRAPRVRTVVATAARHSRNKPTSPMSTANKNHAPCEGRPVATTRAASRIQSVVTSRRAPSLTRPRRSSASVHMDTTTTIARAPNRNTAVTCEHGRRDRPRGDGAELPKTNARRSFPSRRLFITHDASIDVVGCAGHVAFGPGSFGLIPSRDDLGGDAQPSRNVRVFAAGWVARDLIRARSCNRPQRRSWDPDRRTHEAERVPSTRPTTSSSACDGPHLRARAAPRSSSSRRAADRARADGGSVRAGSSTCAAGSSPSSTSRRCSRSTIKPPDEAARLVVVTGPSPLCVHRRYDARALGVRARRSDANRRRRPDHLRPHRGSRRRCDPDRYARRRSSASSANRTERP